MSGITSLQTRGSLRLPFAALLSLLITGLAIGPAIAQFEPASPSAAVAEEGDGAPHLVISELVNGGASASDEFVEIYNPSAGPLPLEGLELVYVSASGATVTRKAAWPAGAPLMPPGGHWLAANAAGLYAPMADTSYANGLASMGGSVALRIQGATTAIDAVGWGNATNTWLEGQPASAVVAGSSLERLPGGATGSGQDTNDNLSDFVVRAVPDPQNAAAAPVPFPSPTGSTTPSESPSFSAAPTESPSFSAAPTESPSFSATPTATPSESDAPSASPTPTPSETASASPSSSATPSPTPLPADPISIAEARLLPDDSPATISGVALTDSAFTDGGGCLADETAGIAVLLSSGAFARGEQLLVAGSVGDRYALRTMRSSAAEVTPLGAGSDPSPAPTGTGSIDEATECELVQLSATIVSSATNLSSGIAFDVDDGSGSVRVLVGPTTGVDTSAWTRGAHLTVIGVAGQRDSSGTGVAGYRVMPRDADDILELLPPSTPTPSSSGSPAATATPSRSSSPTPSPRASTPASVSPSVTPSPSASALPIIDIRSARARGTGTIVHVRGVVTLGSGLVDGATATIQDRSAGIVLRLGDQAGTVRRGTQIDVVGVRSTKSGMLTIRVEKPPTVIGSAAEPAAVAIGTGAAGEQLEARVLVVGGTVTTTPVRSTAGNTAFTIDDGSGPLRVTIFSASGIRSTGLVRGALVSVRGVLGQQTTGQQPARGYRLWPREAKDLQLHSGPASAAGAGGTGTAAHSAGMSNAGRTVAASSRVPRLVALVAGSAAHPAGSRLPSGAAGGQKALSGLTLEAGLDGGPAGGVGSPDSGDARQAGTATGQIEPLAVRPLSSRYVSVLLLSALALVTLLGLLAWRTGVFGRLRVMLERVGDDATVSPGNVEHGTGWGVAPTDGVERLT